MLPHSRSSALLLLLWASCCTTLLCLAAAQGDEDGWLIRASSKDQAWQQSSLAASGGSMDGDDPRLQQWWASFKAHFYKSYPEEAAESKAFANFVVNVQKVTDINTDLGVPFWTSGNFYHDYDYQSFRSRFLMDPNTTLSAQARPATSNLSEAERVAQRRLLQSSVDWRSSDKVAPIKDQGGCGSCWAYAATSVVESAYLINQGLTSKGSKIDLSEQQLIDCANYQAGYSSSACNGGCSDCAMNYIKDVYQTTEDLYPSTQRADACRASSQPPAGKSVRLASGPWYPNHDAEADLMRAVTKQPIVIYFQVLQDFYSYAGGIYVPPANCNGQVNHAMVVVGYHYTGNPSDSYWIIRNSWSAWWGESGYAKIQMTGTSSGPCNMYTFSTAPPTSFSLTLDIPTPAPTPAPTPSPRPSPRPSPSRSSPAPKPRPTPTPAPAPRNSPPPYRMPQFPAFPNFPNFPSFSFAKEPAAPAKKKPATPPGRKPSPSKAQRR